MLSLFNKFSKSLNSKEINNTTNSLIYQGKKEISIDSLKTIMGLIDLTTLNISDTKNRIMDFCLKINRFHDVFPDIPNVAAICVYPSLVSVAHSYLKSKNVQIASVAGGFPASQTFLKIKILEVQLAVKSGATEVDIVLPVGKFLEKNYSGIYTEIKELKAAAGEAKLKVILETGVLPDFESVRKAAILAMDAGADFIKTSTGKVHPAAEPESFYIMVDAVLDFFHETGKIVGIKPAGGISTTEEAIVYYSIVKNTLGTKWLNSKFFRIGASRLANNILFKICELSGKAKMSESYF